MVSRKESERDGKARSAMGEGRDDQTSAGDQTGDPTATGTGGESI